MPLFDFDQKKCPDFDPDFKTNNCTYYIEGIRTDERGYCKLNKKYYRCVAHKNQIPTSHSMLQNFLTCHHLCYLVNFRGIQMLDSAMSPAVKMGAIWDAALGGLYGGIDKDTGKPVDVPATITKYEIDSRSLAKVRGLFRAYKMLEVPVDPNPVIQKPIDIRIPFDRVWGDGVPVEVIVTGYYDRWYPTYFVENKLSGRPDNYDDPYFIQSQVGTYFLADPALEYCIMEIARTPDLKSTGQYEGESDETYSERVYQDCLKRPGHYLMHWDPKTHTYGRKFYRNEFNLEEIKARYLHIFREYWEANQFNGWYKNDRVCNNILPGIECDMKQLCRYNNMSESLYRIRQRPIIF